MSTLLTVLVIAAIVGMVLYMYLRVRKLSRMADLPENADIITLTTANFANQTKNGVILIDFWASWCMPCKMMAPILNELADETKGQAQIAKVNVDDFPDLSAKFGVRSIPTLVLLKNGKEINRFVGVKPKSFLAAQIAKA